MTDTTTAFVDDCTSCGACSSACPFLETYGLPADILRASADTVFLCTNCRACATLCPEGLSPADAFHHEKTARIRCDALSTRVRQARAGAAAYAQRGHSFPFSIWKPAPTVFWPGCGLIGALPSVVTVARRALADVLGQPVGLVLDCCFDPLWQLGDVDAVAAVMQETALRLKRNGIGQIITGCVNCAKVLGSMLPGINVLHALEVLPPTVFHHTGLPVRFHHPCPSARIIGLQEKAAACAGVQATTNAPACCGCGGGIHVIDPSLAAAFAHRAVPTGADLWVLTYCVGCKSTFSRQGVVAHHVLEYLPDISPQNRRVSSGRKWFNRGALGLKLRLFAFGLPLRLKPVLKRWSEKREG